MPAGDLALAATFPDGSIPTTFDPLTLILSLLVSALGSLRFVQFVSEAHSFVLVEGVLASVVYGASSVWSLHFLGMSSVLYPQCTPISYNALLVALSAVCPILSGFVAYVALAAKSGKVRRCITLHSGDMGTSSWGPVLSYGWSCGQKARRVILASIATITGIALMHYTGSFSLTGVRQAHSVWGVVGVVLSCVLLNFLAMLLAAGKAGSSTTRLLNGLLFTAAAAVPHYTSAATVQYYPQDAVAFASCTEAFASLRDLQSRLGIDLQAEYSQHVISLAVAGVNIVLMLPATRLLHKQQRLQRWKRTAETRRVLNAVSGSSTMNYPMVAIRADRFMKLGRLRYHEEVRDAGMLTFFDRPEVASKHFIALYSHQWLGWSAADPDGVQYSAMVRATEQLMQREALAPEELYLWIDTMSIPQANGIGAIQNAIDTLATYSALSRALVVIAPQAVHHDTGEACDLSTYMKRCWCRAEQACHILSQGLGRYYIMDGDELRLPDGTAGWDMEALFVFEGDLTCCRRRHPGGAICDRERLVDTMLLLVHKVLVGETVEDHPELAKVQELIFEHKDRLFPRKIEVRHLDGTATRDLFGDLIQRLMEMEKSGELDNVRLSRWNDVREGGTTFVRLTTDGSDREGPPDFGPRPTRPDKLPRFDINELQRLRKEVAQLQEQLLKGDDACHHCHHCHASTLSTSCSFCDEAADGQQEPLFAI